MDPLSVAAAVIGVISLADVIIQRSCELYLRMKKNEDDLKALVDAVAALSGLLNSLKVTLTARGNLPTTIQQQTVSIRGTLESCEKDLEKAIEIVDAIDEASRISLLFKGEGMRGRIEKLVRRIEQYKSFFILCMQLRTSSRSDAISAQMVVVLDDLASLRAGQEVLTSYFDLMLQEKAAQRKEQMLQWLGPTSEAVHMDLCKQRDSESASWIFEREEFIDWVYSDGTSLLWLNGKQGCGKSIIVSKVIEGIRDLFVGSAGASSAAVAFNYCRFSDPSTHSSAKLMGAFISQVFSQALAKLTAPALQSLERIYDRHHRKDTYPDFSDLVALFVELCKPLDRVFLVIDGLDEVVDRREMIEFLENRFLVEGNFKILLSSRPEMPDLVGLLPVCKTVRVGPNEIDADIKRYIRKRLGSLRPNRKPLTPVEHAIVFEKLAGLADGMFLWVACQLNHLSHELRTITAKTLAQTLQSLPRDLEGTFERIFERMNSTHMLTAQRILQLIILAEEPLSLPELVEGIAIQPGMKSLEEVRENKLSDESFVFDICGSLIHQSTSTGKLSLSHYSVQEFLTSERLSDGRENRFFISASNITVDLAAVCLDYLGLEDFGSESFRHGIEQILDRGQPADAPSFSVDSPFLDYAARHWVSYLSRVDSSELRTRYWHRLRRFFDPDRGNFASWASIARIFHGAYKYPPGLMPIHAAALCGLTDIAQLLLDEQPAAISARTPDGRTALHMALENSHEPTAEVLMGRGAPLTATDNQGRTPLHIATETGNELAVITMTTSGPDADVNARDAEGRTPVSISVENGWDQLADFLAPLANLELLLPDGRSLLHLSAQAGSHTWTTMLLERRSDDLLSARDETDWTPLHYAAVGGNEKALMALLEAGAHPESSDRHGLTPLHVAIRHHRRHCAAALLAARPRRPLSPFERMHPITGEPVSYMSDFPTSTAYQGKYGDQGLSQAGLPSPLLVAVAGSDVEDVKLLLDHARDVPRDGGRVGLPDMTACFAKAVEMNNSDILRVLTPLVPRSIQRRDRQLLLSTLRHHVQESSSGGAIQQGDTVAALIRRHWQDVFFLEDLLGDAVRSSEVEVVQFLLDTWPTLATGVSQIVLDAVKLTDGVVRGRMVRLLVASGADVVARDLDDMTPADIAIDLGDMALAEFLQHAAGQHAGTSERTVLAGLLG